MLDAARKYSVESVIVSSVKKDHQALIKKIEDALNLQVVDFNQAEIGKYGSRILYQGGVGPDRIAAYIGAEEAFPSVAKLIADAGTALTLDVADSDGKFCGGSISLGLNSRLKDLAGATSLLPEVGFTGNYVSFGHSTEEAITSGAVNGIIGEIFYAEYRAKKEYKVEMTVLTGGDAEFFYETVFHDYPDYVCDPRLVTRGLNRHLRTFYSYL